MNRTTKLLLSIFLLIALTGCASQSKIKRNSFAEEASKKQMEAIKEKINQANYHFKQKEWNTASLIYQELLNDYVDNDGGFACAVRTNLALVNLEEGSQLHFKNNVKKLFQECSKQELLSRETQWVLSINNHIDGKSNNQLDTRIELRFHNNINELFQGGK